MLRRRSSVGVTAGDRSRDFTPGALGIAAHELTDGVTDFRSMFTTRIGAGAVVRVARASLSLDAPAGRRIGIDARGAHAGGGARIAF